MAKIEVLIEFLSSRRAPLSIPSSFLVDAEGNVAAVYLQAVSWDQLDSDLALLHAPPEAQLKQVSPRAGRWFADPRQVDRAAFETGQWDKAEDHYRRVQLLNPRMSFAHFGLGTLQARREQHADAVVSFRKAISLGGTSARAYTQLGLSLLALGENQAAADALERALELDPQYERAKRALSILPRSR